MSKFLRVTHRLPGIWNQVKGEGVVGNGMCTEIKTSQKLLNILKPKEDSETAYFRHSAER